jgi:hypothetical protein
MAAFVDSENNNENMDLTSVKLLMMRRFLIISLLMPLIFSPVIAQTRQEDLKREVTLYNPYKPSLSDARKKSFLPDITDTSAVRPEFTYKITTTPYSPEYTISPIKPAVIQPDPLPKLYRSYLKAGFGNYFTPLAELSIANERSKKGALGFNARHFSTNGEIKLDNGEKVFAGYMDNDASLYGKKFFRSNLLEGSIDYNQKVRYAYGYDPGFVSLIQDKKDVRIGYNNLGANLSLSSLTLDSSKYSYDFDVHYYYFTSAKDFHQQNAGMSGTMATLFKGYYAGSDVNFEYFNVFNGSKYVFGLSPFLKKSTQQWNFKAGINMVFDNNIVNPVKFHLYPDVNFGFSIVPSYVSFFAGLNGKLEINEPKIVIEENPFIVTWGPLYNIPNSSHSMIVSAGLKGNTGIGGNYLLSASYSMVNNLMFFANFYDPEYVLKSEWSNFFLPVVDDAEVLKIHGEMTGQITDKLSYIGNANWYRYTLTDLKYPWNKPDWDGKLGIEYNLRDKILAGLSLTALGKRHVSTTFPTHPEFEYETQYPAHFNLNLSAEYRYSKILSFWVKFNNIAYNKYYEWAFYPTHRFLFMGGFTYNL